MKDRILLVSKSKTLLQTRALMLKRAGYSTLRVSTVTGGVGLAFCCNLAIIDATFAGEDHKGFVDRVHQKYPSLMVLCLRASLIKQEALITVVTNCLASHAAGPRVIVIDDPETPPQ